MNRGELLWQKEALAPIAAALFAHHVMDPFHPDVYYHHYTWLFCLLLHILLPLVRFAVDNMPRISPCHLCWLLDPFTCHQVCHRACVSYSSSHQAAQEPLPVGGRRWVRPTVSHQAGRSHGRLWPLPGASFWCASLLMITPRRFGSRIPISAASCFKYHTSAEIPPSCLEYHYNGH